VGVTEIAARHRRGENMHRRTAGKRWVEVTGFVVEDEHDWVLVSVPAAAA